MLFVILSSEKQWKKFHTANILLQSSKSFEIPCYTLLYRIQQIKYTMWSNKNRKDKEIYIYIYFFFWCGIKVFHIDSNYLYVSIFQDSNVIFENVNSIDGYLSSFLLEYFVVSSQLIATCYLFYQIISLHPLVIDKKLLVERQISTYLEIEKLNNISNQLNFLNIFYGLCKVNMNFMTT